MDMTHHQLQQLQQFHQFALARLQCGDGAVTIDELFDQWRLCNPISEEHADNCRAIAASIRDFDDGERGVAAEEFMDQFRSGNASE